jgi:hypothetical protein
LAVKIFWLKPNDAAWLSPDEVVARLRDCFDNVTEDREAARMLGDRFLKTYRALIEAGHGDEESTPLDVVERQWRDAILVKVSDNTGAAASFEVMVQNEYRLELVFPAKAAFQKKRRAAEKMAKALGYEIEHFDPAE